MAVIRLYRADRRKIMIIPPGVNPEHFRPLSSAAAKTKLDLPLDSQLLLFVGRIEPLKGIDTILQALHYIHSTTP
jgi:D-inositol-3-phosphate glycosyltransferase